MKVGIRNVMTAGDQHNQVIDHFPISRAGRWQSNQNKIIENQNEHQESVQ